MVIFHSYVSLPESNSPVINPPPPQPSEVLLHGQDFLRCRARLKLFAEPWALATQSAMVGTPTTGTTAGGGHSPADGLSDYPTIYENGLWWWGDFCIKQEKKIKGIYSVFKVVWLEGA